MFVDSITDPGAYPWVANPIDCINSSFGSWIKTSLLSVCMVTGRGIWDPCEQPIVPREKQGELPRRRVRRRSHWTRERASTSASPSLAIPSLSPHDPQPPQGKVKPRAYVKWKWCILTTRMPETNPPLSPCPRTEARGAAEESGHLEGLCQVGLQGNLVPEGWGEEEKEKTPPKHDCEQLHFNYKTLT